MDEINDLLKKYESKTVIELECKVNGEDLEKVKNYLKAEQLYVQYIYKDNKTKYLYLKFLNKNFPNLDYKLKSITNIDIERFLVLFGFYSLAQFVFYKISRRLLFNRKLFSFISASIMNFVLLGRKILIIDQFYVDRRFDKDLNDVFEKFSNDHVKRGYLDFRKKLIKENELVTEFKKSFNI